MGATDKRKSAGYLQCFGILNSDLEYQLLRKEFPSSGVQLTNEFCHVDDNLKRKTSVKIFLLFVFFHVVQV